MCLYSLSHSFNNYVMALSKVCTVNLVLFHVVTNIPNVIFFSLSQFQCSNFNFPSFSSQVDEVEALSAIYGTDFHTESAETGTYSIDITEGDVTAVLQVWCDGVVVV